MLRTSPWWLISVVWLSDPFSKLQFSQFLFKISVVYNTFYSWICKLAVAALFRAADQAQLRFIDLLFWDPGGSSSNSLGHAFLRMDSRIAKRVSRNARFFLKHLLRTALVSCSLGQSEWGGDIYSPCFPGRHFNATWAWIYNPIAWRKQRTGNNNSVYHTQIVFCF